MKDTIKKIQELYAEEKKELLQKFNDYRNNVILKSRQMGISTITAAYVSWMLLFHLPQGC